MSAPHAVEWRYAAAGLGWGVAVGAATGLLCGLGWAAVALAGGGVDGGRVVEWASLLLGAPVLGLLLGATLGGVVGTPGGLAGALALVPALLGGWLTARTGRLLRRRRSAAALRWPRDRQDASTAACSSERRK